jgi:phenylpropionate dioxygenase-like ring-hydroxylating dioxygenase large terminal subunit/AcrR family transcriptional regulator
MTVPETALRAERVTREDRRRELIECAIEVIAENGLAGTTLVKVAAKAGLSAGIVNHYFETKDALLIEALRSLSEEFSAALEAATQAAATPEDGLLAIIDLSLDKVISAPPKIAVWYAFQSETHWRQSYTSLCGERDQAYMVTIKTLMALLAGPQAADADILARSFAGLLDSYWQDILFEGENFDRAAAASSCRRYLATIFPAKAASLLAADAAPARVENVVALKPGGAGTGDKTDKRPGPHETLPGWTYSSEEFFALETEKIFMTEWHIVCHVNQLRAPGDYQTFELLNERAFVIRGKDNVIRAFHNVCRHRAHALVSGAAGHCPGAIVCPYHGWGYELNGNLKGVAAPHSFAEFDRQEFGLKPLQLEIWMGFVFIRFGGAGMSVAERFAPYEAELKLYRLDEMVPVGDLTLQDTGADWKNVWDNYLEGYHFTKGHPGLARLMDSQYDLDAQPDMRVARLSHKLRHMESPTWSGRMYQKILERPEHLPEQMRESWTYFFMFPLLSFDIYPDVIGHFQVIPTAAGASQLRYQNYALPEQVESRRGRAARWLNFRINGQVQSEDDHLVASVQGGLKSRAYSKGILSEKEVIVHNFQNWIRQAIPLADTAAKPAAGTMATRNALLGGRC